MRPMNKNAVANAKFCIDQARAAERDALREDAHQAHAREDANISVELWVRAVEALLWAAT